MLYEEKFLFSLFFTLVVEILSAIIFIKYLLAKKEIKISKIILVGILASSSTLPYLWFVLPIFIRDRNSLILIGEFLVILTEAIIYNQLLNIKFSKALIV